MNRAYARFLASSCAFFVVSLYVKLREVVVTDEYHDAVHATGPFLRAYDAWYTVVFSRDEAIVFLALAALTLLVARLRPAPGAWLRSTAGVCAWGVLPVLSAIEVMGLSYYDVYQTPFPMRDIVFLRWARELAASSDVFSSRVVIGLGLIVVAYGAAWGLYRRLPPRPARRLAQAVTAGAALILACGVVAPRPVLAGSLLSPHPVVWFFVGERPSFERLPADEALVPIGPARRAHDVAVRPRNVILVVLESTPASVVYPYNAAATAGRRLLDTFPDDVTVFDSVYAPAPFSARSFVAMAFGQRPWMTPASAPPRSETLAEILRRRGFRTEAYFMGDSALPGYDDVTRRGLDRFVDENSGEGVDRYARLSWGRDDRFAFDEMGKFIDRQPLDGQPFFLTVVTANPHVPYEIGKLPGRQPIADPKAAHAALVEYDFDLFTDFYARLKKSGLAETTAVLVVGDHGEAFNEHADNIIHSKNLYEENVHVACLLVAPGRLGLPRRIPQLGTLQDMRATVFDLLGIQEPAGHGVSLLFEAPERWILSSTDYGPGQLALRDARYTYVLWPTSGRSALFDRQTDPGEHRDVSAEHPDVAARFRSRLGDFIR